MRRYKKGERSGVKIHRDEGTFATATVSLTSSGSYAGGPVLKVHTASLLCELVLKVISAVHP